jgi:hypothetical protein
MAPTRLCQIPDCGQKHYALGWCNRHWQVWRNHGDPLGGGTSRGAPADWLATHATLAACTPDTCLIWPFSTVIGGYGRLKVAGKKHLAHRLVCEQTHGPAPADRPEAAHRCGVAGCVNPYHVRWASAKENAADKKLHKLHLNMSKEEI